MQIATWNVNSLKVRLAQVMDWLQLTGCDVLGLQELKLDNESNAKLVSEFKAIGYNYVYNGQKTYNGVALLSRHPLADIVYDIADYSDEQKRVIAATIKGVRVICAYFVNGESLESPKYQYKLAWLEKLHLYIKAELEKYPNLVLLGDYNIAPESRDTYNSIIWENQVLCSEPERTAFNNLIQLGLVDSFRHFNQEERQFTWWDYRSMAFRRKQGLRIDHLLVTPGLLASAESCIIDVAPRKLERPSDHTPVILRLK